jgi:hypothetical protein
MTDRDLMQQALDALENSVDLVREDAYQAEKLYGNYPTRQGKVNGLKVLADDHEKAITALTERLAQPEQETVYHLRQYGDVTKEQFERYAQTGSIAPPAAQQIDEAHSAGYSNGMTEGYEAGKAYAAAQRKPLTDEQLNEIAARGYVRWVEFARAIEAAHGIKENT